MGLVGIVGITVLRGTQLWPSLGDIIWNTANSFTLVAIPLFVLMGEIILRSGAARRFYMGLAVLLNNVPGGLAQSNIMACALFSAICGSSTATALTIGTVALPEMRKRGYSDKITLGTLTGGGALGNLIPPSMFLLVYATVVQQSAIDLFIATIIPGAIAVLMFMAYVAYRALTRPDARSGEGAAAFVARVLPRARPDRADDAADRRDHRQHVFRRRHADRGGGVRLPARVHPRAVLSRDDAPRALDRADQQHRGQLRDVDHRHQRPDPRLRHRAGRHRPRRGGCAGACQPQPVPVLHDAVRALSRCSARRSTGSR